MFDVNHIDRANNRGAVSVTNPFRRAQVLNAIRAEIERHGDDGFHVDVQAVALYDRKSYPSYGPLADELDDSPYRRDGEEQIVLQVTIVSNPRNYDADTAELRALRADLASDQINEHIKTINDRAARLRSEAARLLAEAADIDAQKKD